MLDDEFQDNLADTAARTLSEGHLELRLLTSELEQRVAERTQALEAANERLGEANDRLSRLVAPRLGIEPNGFA